MRRSPESFGLSPPDSEPSPSTRTAYSPNEVGSGTTMLTWSLVVLLSVVLVAAIVAVSHTARRFVLTVAVLGKAALGTLWDGLRGRPDTGPVSLRHAFEHLGPTYVK